MTDIDMTDFIANNMVANINITLTLSGGESTELEFGYTSDLKALVAVGKLLGYSGEGIMHLLSPIVPPELQHLVDPPKSGEGGNNQ